MKDLLNSLLELAVKAGKIVRVNMYDENYITIEGTTAEGKKFNITYSVD